MASTQSSTCATVQDREAPPRHLVLTLECCDLHPLSRQDPALRLRTSRLALEDAVTVLLVEGLLDVPGGGRAASDALHPTALGS
jgi:hypothetical protein